MKRPALAVLAFATIGTSLTAVVVAGHSQRQSELRATENRERAARTVRRTAAVQDQTAPARPTLKVCPRGAEGLGNTARRSIRRKLLADDGSVDAEALEEMSNIAIAAGRYLERARAAPALPQRLGRERRVRADGSKSWEPIDSPKLGCARVARAAKRTTAN